MAHPVKMAKIFSSVENGYSSRSVAQIYGCQSCPFIETEVCPHSGEVTKERPHVNGICSQRVMQVKELYGHLNSTVRITQVDLAAKLTILDDHLFQSYMKDKNAKILLPYSHINKNLISHLDKMRRQDEGVKVSVDSANDHDTVRRIIEASAKVLEEKGIKNITQLENLNDKPGN